MLLLKEHKYSLTQCNVADGREKGENEHREKYFKRLKILLKKIKILIAQ